MNIIFTFISLKKAYNAIYKGQVQIKFALKIAFLKNRYTAIHADNFNDPILYHEWCEEHIITGSYVTLIIMDHTNYPALLIATILLNSK